MIQQQLRRLSIDSRQSMTVEINTKNNKITLFFVVSDFFFNVLVASPLVVDVADSYYHNVDLWCHGHRPAHGRNNFVNLDVTIELDDVE